MSEPARTLKLPLVILFSLLTSAVAGGGAIPGVPISLLDSHGGDPTEWPDDLRVREFPR